MVLFIMTVMAGRVVPMFTNNGVPGTQAQRHPRGREGWCWAACWHCWPPPPWVCVEAVLVLLAAGRRRSHTARGCGCGNPGRTTPPRWCGCCMLAYAWIPLHLLLRAGAEVACWPHRRHPCADGRRHRYCSRWA
jgi:uncharacterized protein involved in response to NO